MVDSLSVFSTEGPDNRVEQQKELQNRSSPIYQPTISFNFVTDSNEITPSKLLGSNTKVKEKFSVVLDHSYHKSKLPHFHWHYI
jgi:hypothetical protein